MLASILPALVIAVWVIALFVGLGGLHADVGQRRYLWVAAACLAPSAAAWALGAAWRFSPGLSESATVAWLLGSAATIVLLGSWRNKNRLLECLRPPLLRLGASEAALVLLLAVVVYLVLRVPAYSNDPLEYAAVARLLEAQRSLSVYPVLDTVVSRGLYAPWTHPPGFPLLISLVMALSQVDAVTALKWAAALHAVLGVLALWALLPRRMRWFAVLSLIATPAYAIGVINGYVEAVRLTSLIGVFAACLALWQAPALASALRLGILFGLCGFVHSLGILSAALFLPVLMLRRKASNPSRLLWGTGIVAMQLLLLAPDLGRNISLFGVVLGDRPAIWQIPEIGRAEYFREFRGLVGPIDLLFRGLLQGFSQVSNFGLSYWIPAALGLGLVVASRQATPLAGHAPDPRANSLTMELSAGIVATFYALAAALTLAGSIEAIKNARYFLTVQPFVAVLTAWLALRLLHSDAARRALGAGLAMCSLVPLVYMSERHPGLLTSSMDRRQAYFTYALPEADVVREIDRRSETGRCAMLFQQSDYALYGKGCFRSFLDHRFADVYLDPSPRNAADRLRAMGISLIVTPSHALPEIYNTAVGRLLADPALARLDWAAGGFSIYTLVRPTDVVPILQPAVRLAVPPEGQHQKVMFEWEQLLAPLPAQGALSQRSGVLCFDATGRGIVDLTTLAPGAAEFRTGFLLGFVRSASTYVMAADVRGRRQLCVQQLPEQARGRLKVEASPGVRVEQVSYSRALWPASLSKEP